MKYVMAAAYAATIVLANWTLNRYGMVHLLWLGPLVPAGVYWAGLSFSVRDVLQDVAGTIWTLIAILAGAVVSAVIAPNLAIASGVAFLLSEMLDFAVYTPLRQRRWLTAVVASNVVGSIADSLLFLGLAFGWPAARAGWLNLSIGKALMTVPAVAAIALWRSRPATATVTA